MRRFQFKRFSFIILALFSILSLPPFFVEKVRLQVASFFSFFWKKTAQLPKAKESSLGVLNKQLESENLLLKKEITKLYSLLDFRHEVEQLAQEKCTFETLSLNQRAKESCFLESFYLNALPAQIIYRDPSNWMSCCWISVGEQTNERLGKKVVSKNSPVVLGRSVVGAIDLVGAQQSRVRLLTDLGMKPAVRAVRGSVQQLAFQGHLEALVRALKNHIDVSLSNEEIAKLTATLEAVQARQVQQQTSLYLAKGIVQGRSAPLWKGGGHFLRGIGFNYDFSDDEGPARDLFSGALQDECLEKKAHPLLKEGDLLITTGMDGVFPAGLRVGEVIAIFPLREGAFSYELLALPSAGSFDELQTVYVLPSLEFQPEKRDES